MQYENVSEKEQFSADEGATERALPFQRIKMEKNRFRYDFRFKIEYSKLIFSF
jgi:hypothetical protein